MNIFRAIWVALIIVHMILTVIAIAAGFLKDPKTNAEEQQETAK